MTGGHERGRAVFREEAAELLSELEASLLELEESPGDEELISRVFRAMHTIKGSGAMFGFDDIAAFTHEVETIFDMVRQGRMKVTRELIDLTLAARDHIRSMLESEESGHRPDVEKGESILAGLRRLAPGMGDRAEPAATDAPSTSEPLEPEEDEVSYRLRFRPSPDILRMGTNPVLLLNELRGMGECRVIAQTDAIPLLDEIDPEACYTYWDIILTTSRGINAIRDVFIFVESDSELKIDVIDDGGRLDKDTGYKRLGDILIERGDLRPEDLRQVLEAQKRIGEMLVEARVVDHGKVESALLEQQHVRELREKRKRTESASSVRVASDKLDRLVDLVGELVTVQARLSRTAVLQGGTELLSIAEEVERLTMELRDSTMSIRMLPIGSTFNKFRRLVRDLANELGKEVVMTTDGAETELDKTIIERLNDPLVHLIRNSIDHGIEPPDVRTAAGKPRQGTVHLSAAHSGAQVMIRIRDDGAGMDTASILRKAVEKGIVPPDAELAEEEIFSLIFAPGFSTAEKVTDVSGRGVGMDVVKQSIESLGGSIDIESRRGRGTSITLKLPLTLAIIEGLLVKIGDGFFVLPLSSVEECVELTVEDRERSHGRHLADVRGEIVPYIRLRDLFMSDTAAPPIEQIVIVRADGRRVGFVVDSVIGEHQTVIKTLGRIYRDAEGISGATILGDGTVALVLDVNRLVHHAELEEATAVMS